MRELRSWFGVESSLGRQEQYKDKMKVKRGEAPMQKVDSLFFFNEVSVLIDTSLKRPAHLG